MPYKDKATKREKDRIYSKNRYRSDPKHRLDKLERNKVYIHQLKENGKALIMEFRSKGYAICGETENCCLCAHHLHNKEFGISAYVRLKISSERLANELKKCVCLCHNCHAKIHSGLVKL